MKFLIFVFVNIGGYIGWELGESHGLTTAFFASGAGSVLGVYVGWKLGRLLLE